MDDVRNPKTALECKAEWCEKILSGEKIVECRQYALPAELLNEPIFLVATTGTDGVASLADSTDAGSSSGQICGVVIFSDCICYDSAASFAADEPRHCVSSTSVYAWQGAPVYGWVVGGSSRIEPPRQLPALQRMHRSIHRVVD